MTSKAWPEALKRPPMCPKCAQATLDALIARRQAADAEGDRATVDDLGRQINRMLGWRYPCAEPDLPPVVSLGEIVVYQRERSH